ncbi:hypothetical protein F6W69_10625 [Microbacterium oxydans]|uniref:hypothetical protein n=1 Tax=Microbacterium oxydans TaxID=82380 RepID=UPI00114434D9|nr:hypothetical protein [Microbacterium oxydans]KAB1891043.1 hypothetical protein F6W69_10625 [Microbacterium oxydans]GED39095.1 hypothetical protein MOX01_22370 [Microbacterium oxydans]
MVTRLDRAYDVQVHQLRLTIQNFAMRYWNSMGSWRDDDIKRLLAAVAPRVQAGQQRISDITDAYMARVAAEQGFTVSGRTFEATTRNLRGISDETLYARPFATMHDSLSKGQSVTAAVAAGKGRLQSIVTTNLQLAKTHSSRRAMRSGGVRAFERVLTGRENCALCVIASTQRYWVEDLAPIHPGCDCQSRPLNSDPAVQIIHPDRLDAIHTAVESEFGSTDRGARYLDGRNEISDYLDLIAVREHGELGPVLTWRDQHFTTKREIDAS